MMADEDLEGIARKKRGEKEILEELIDHEGMVRENDKELLAKVAKDLGFVDDKYYTASEQMMKGKQEIDSTSDKWF
ncbi:MAG: hypothetical protein ABII01_01015 [Candidatus Woesearchaeota archaeon]